MASQPSFLGATIGTLRQQPLSYALGRFSSVRRLYGTALSIGQRFRQPPPNTMGARLFKGIHVDDAVDALRAQSVYVAPLLPADVVAEIHRFACEAVCRRQERSPTFKASEVRNGRLSTGELVVLADVLDAERNDAVYAVSTEPSVIDVVSKYLGYVPVRRRARLIWSFVSDADRASREREGQTVTYHFDVQSYNFVYGNYYISDVDARSGAHTMVVGSHNDKPLAWLFGSARRTDSEIRAYYGPDREITLVGPAGFSFIQDSSCYHRALAPSDRARLMLQVRYF